MTVKELIEELNQYNIDDTVVFEFDDEFYDISSIYVEQVRQNVSANVSHGDYYTTSWDECTDPKVSVLVLSEKRLWKILIMAEA